MALGLVVGLGDGVGLVLAVLCGLCLPFGQPKWLPGGVGFGSRCPFPFPFPLEGSPSLRRLPLKGFFASGLPETASRARSLKFALEDAVSTTVSSRLPKVNELPLLPRCDPPAAEASRAVDRPNSLPSTPGLFVESNPGAPLLSLACLPIIPGLLSELNPGPGLAGAGPRPRLCPFPLSSPIPALTKRNKTKPAPDAKRVRLRVERDFMSKDGWMAAFILKPIALRQ